MIDSVCNYDFLSLYSIISSATQIPAQISSFHNQASVCDVCTFNNCNVMFIWGSYTGITEGAGLSLPRKEITKDTCGENLWK